MTLIRFTNLRLNINHTLALPYAELLIDRYAQADSREAKQTLLRTGRITLTNGTYAEVIKNN